MLLNSCCKCADSAKKKQERKKERGKKRKKRVLYTCTVAEN